MAAPALSTRNIAKVFFTVVALAAFVYLLYLVRSVIMLLFIAIFLAVALGRPVDFFHRRRVPRGLSILLVFALLFLTIFLVGLLVVPPVVEQVDGLSKNIPGYISDLRDNNTFRDYDQRYSITPKLEEQARTLPSRLADAASTLQAVTVGVFSALVQLITVLTIVFFLLLDGKRLTEFLLGLLDSERERRFREVGEEVYRAVGGYVAGALTIATIAGTTTYLMLTIIGVEFAVPLAVLMAFLDLIPLIGATIGAILIGVVTLFFSFPAATIAWAIFALVYQQAENNLLQPFVYRRTVDVHPLGVITAILMGSTLLGVLGALVAIPIAATAQILVRDWWLHRRRRQQEALVSHEGVALPSTVGPDAPPTADPPPPGVPA